MLALAVVGVALSFLARNSAVPDGGAGPAALLVYAVVGVDHGRGGADRRRRPGRQALPVLDSRLHHGALPLGPVSVSLTMRFVGSGLGCLGRSRWPVLTGVLVRLSIVCGYVVPQPGALKSRSAEGLAYRVAGTFMRTRSPVSGR